MDTVTQLTSQLVKIDSSDPGAYEDTIGDFIGAWLRANAPTAVITKSEVLPGRYNVRAVLTGKVAELGEKGSRSFVVLHRSPT